MTFLASRWPPR